MKLRIGCVLVGFLSLVLSLAAQTSGISPASAQVPPPLIQFSNVATDEGGNTLSGMVSITFSLYSSQLGGEPLWTETQNNVQLDPTGHYSVQLGITQPNGVPTALFTSGEARWLGVRIAEQAEQPRVLLLSVPYALKAGDAATIGGLPPSAFVLAAPPNGAALASTADSLTAQSVSPDTATDVTTTGGTAGYLPFFNGATTILDSVVFQSATSPFKIGINTATPATTLDVKGAGTIRGALSVLGTLSLPATGPATATAGKNSQPDTHVASAYNSSTSTAVNQTFQWQAEPAGNDTSAPSGTLNLLFGQGTTKPSETGLHIASNGQITFATGQTFPGTGDGTITGVTAGTDLTGGGTSGNVTLNVNTTALNSSYAQLAAANTFTGNQTVNGNLSATGTVTGSSYQIGSHLFAFGSYGKANAFLGFAGNTTTTGSYNTATGYTALYSNTSGDFNTASGIDALDSNTSGGSNTASGALALNDNTTGNYNTAIGSVALAFNTTGNQNDAFGYAALYSNNAGPNDAFGYQALYSNTVGGSNAAFGYQALYSNVGDSAMDGWFNTAVGGQALYTNNDTSGTGSNAKFNVAVGFQALYSNTTGCCNTASGLGPLFSNTSGSGNTAVGYVALNSNTTGSNLTCIGAYCTTDADALTNATAIGAHAVVGQSNSLVLGGTGKYGVKVGIGTTTPSNVLTVGRGTGHPVSDSWETYSSRRWKTNIKTLPDALSKVEQLRGVSYDLKDSGKHEIGVIAEEVGQVVPEVVSYEKNGKDATGVDYSRLTALLIEATKEQQREIQHQQAALRTQAAAIRDLKSELRATRQTLQKVKAQGAATRPTLVAAK